MQEINSSMQAWAQAAFAKCSTKLSSVRERSAHKILSRAIDGVHNDKSDASTYPHDDGLAWWTNGFWAGMMWQMHHATGDMRYAEIAQETECKLDACFESFTCLHHDVGFMWLPSAVAHHRLTGDANAYRRGLHAANLLAGRFNPTGFIRAWNDIPGKNSDTRGWAIVDSQFNIPLLYWASETTGDVRFRKIAETHANTLQKHFVRQDGSVRHIVEFCPETGAFIKEYGGQGMAEGSSWTRGQTWGLYGFVMSYKHTEHTPYLQTATQIADVFLTRIPESGRIPVDFCQAADLAWYDDIAAAVAACGLIELACLVPQKSNVYLTAAFKMLKALEETADFSPATDGILQNCSAEYHTAEHNVNFTYGDYYFLEVILKLTKQELYLW